MDAALFTLHHFFFKVPAFEATDGTCLTESNAIAYYVANNALRASESPVHSAQVIQWMQFADSEILPASCTWVFPTLGKLLQVRSLKEIILNI